MTNSKFTMENPKNTQGDFGFVVPVGHQAAAHMQPVAQEDCPKGARTVRQNGPKRTKASLPEPAKVETKSNAKDQKERREKLTAIGLRRVETWVPEKISVAIKSAAASEGVTKRDFIAKKLTAEFQNL